MLQVHIPFFLIMKKIITAFISILENAPTSYTLWLTSFLGLISVRIMIENWLGEFPERSATFFLYEFSHTFLFFLFAYLLFLPILKRFAKISLLQASNLALVGFLIMLTPPLIDFWISAGKGLWSFYKFDSLMGMWHRFYTLFGDQPNIGITYGVRIEVVIVTLIFGCYTYFKTQDRLRALLASLSIYTLLFILGTFPSWLTIALLGFQKGFLTVREVDIAQLFLSPPAIFARSGFDIMSSLNVKMSLVFGILDILLAILYLRQYFSKLFFALIGNARFPQMIYHGGLLCVGMALASIFTSTSIRVDVFNILAFITMVIAVESAWLASVVVNDLFDIKTDILTNPKRPLPQHKITLGEYKAIGFTFFGVSLLFAAIVNVKTMLLLLMYQGLAWLYSAWPLRLKRFPLVATFVGAIAGILVLLSGFLLIAPEGNIQALPGRILLLCALVYTFSLPLKDFKDIAGDKAEGVLTLPVLLGETWGKIVIGSGLFFSYLLSVWFLHEPRLFWGALLCGGLSFWLLLSAHNQETGWLRYRLLPGWILTCVAFYGLILTWIIL
jgi:4-hydroxybenzoate polyprenyltransferase